MNPVGGALAGAMVLAVAAAVAGLSLPVGWRARIGAPVLSLSGAFGVAAGVAAVAGHTWQASLADLLPLAGVRLEVDALSGWFLLLIGAVTVIVGVYTIGYAGRGGHGPGSRTSLAILPLFTAAMLLVPAAASVPTFLLCWELMAVTSLLLVATEHRHHDQVRPAVVWYAAMTQAGFITLLVGLTWAGAAAADSTFEGIRHAAAGVLSPVVRGGVNAM